MNRACHIPQSIDDDNAVQDACDRTSKIVRRKHFAPRVANPVPDDGSFTEPENRPGAGVNTDTAVQDNVSDEEHLERLERKLDLVRDRTVGVVEGYDPGFFLYGAGGIGKSFTVKEVLEKRQADHELINSHLTGRALFDLLEQRPDFIYVLEDMEQLMHDRRALGVLRSALWGQQGDGGQGRLERRVTWMVHRTRLTAIFTGGIILIGNRPLASLPELDALRTRIPVILLQPSEHELRAKMRSLARQGFQHGDKRLTPEECLEVCDFIIKRSRALSRPLDLRLLVNSFKDRLQWGEGEAACPWQVLVEARLTERAAAFDVVLPPQTRAGRKQCELEVVRQIVATTSDRAERVQLWKEKVGKSESAFYRRLRELSVT